MNRLWFFPLVKMEFSGYEVVLFLMFLCCLLSFDSMLKMVLSVHSYLRVVSVFCLLAHFCQDATNKLILVNVGLGLELTLHMALWFHSKERMERHVFGLLVSLVIFVTWHMASYSVNPVWTSTKVNMMFFLTGILSCMILSQENLASNLNKASISKHSHEPSSLIDNLRVGLSFGALLSLTNLLFTNYSVLSRWTELLPFPSSLLLIFAMLVGVALYHSNFRNKLEWFLFALFSSISFVSFNVNNAPDMVNLYKMLGGSALSVYVFTSWFSVVEKLRRNRSFVSLLFVVLSYLFFLFFAVYIVSYKFVPMGWIARERNASLVILSVLFIGLAHIEDFGLSHKRKSKPADSTRPFLTNGQVLTVIIVIALFVVFPCTLHRINHSSYTPDPSPQLSTTSKEAAIRSVIWTIHFGYDNNGGISFGQIERKLRERDVNVIGLLESDLSRIMTSNRDLVDYLASKLKMYSDFGPSTAQNTWGCALLSSFPIISSKRNILPSPYGELACFIDATLDVNGVPTHVFVTHFGNTEDEIDRSLQSQAIAKYAQLYEEEPLVVLGYFTTRTNAPNYMMVVSTGLQDTAHDQFDRYCEYIFYKNLELHSFSRHPPGITTDTEQQVAFFKQPKSKPNSIRGK